MTTPWPALEALPPSPNSMEDEGREQAPIKPFVHDDGQSKSLHFTMGELQSRMNLRNPGQLDVDYTRTMMGFLLFHPAPASLAMIGLGGGSLAKFCYHQLADCQITVIEINPHVIALRREFQVPDDDARFQVVEADGAAFLATNAVRFDVLLVDGFDHQGQPAALCSQQFYDDCFAALTPTGVLVVNLHHDAEDFLIWVERIQRSFGGNAAEVLSLEKSNCIVLASRGQAISPRHMNLAASLSKLDPSARGQLKAEFARMVWCMKDLS